MTQKINVSLQLTEEELSELLLALTLHSQNQNLDAFDNTYKYRQLANGIYKQVKAIQRSYLNGPK